MIRVLWIHFFLITDTSVSDAMAVLSTPDVSSILQSIIVTCTIHPNSTADQCVVMAMDDGGVNRTGNEVNHIGTVKDQTICMIRYCPSNQWNSYSDS